MARLLGMKLGRNSDEMGFSILSLAVSDYPGICHIAQHAGISSVLVL